MKTIMFPVVEKVSTGPLRKRNASPPAEDAEGSPQLERSDVGTPEYEVVDNCTCLLVRDKNGMLRDVPLANFSATITQAIEVDDGVEKTRFFDLALVGAGWKYSITNLPAEQFEELGWVIPVSHGKARVLPRMKPQMRDAIQALSGGIPTQVRYRHLGFRQIEGQWYYLHAGGAISPNGATTTVVVDAGDKFQRFKLPDPCVVAHTKVNEAVRDTLKLLEVAAGKITAPLYCAIWRAPLGLTDFSLHLVGPTGSGKTVLGALAQQHWGAELDAQHCPGSWSSTANANEGARFLAKDAIFLLDDLSPGAASASAIDRTFRGQGNASGRDRMRPDSTLRPTKPPRGLLLSTGEDSPLLHSAAARTLVLDMSSDSLNWAKITECQIAAGQGQYALAMAAYIRWIAQRYDTLMAAKPKRVAELRAQYLAAKSDAHKRTPGITAELTFACETFLTFAEETGAIPSKRAKKLKAVIATGLQAAAAAQRDMHAVADPVVRFQELLRSVLSSGRAHVTTQTGTMPGEHAVAWGWRRSEPQGRHIGWVIGQDLLLDKDAAFAALVELDRETGGVLPSQAQLWKRLRDRKILASVDQSRGTLTVRRVLSGVRREVLHLRGSLVVQGREQLRRTRLGGPDEDD